MKDSAIYKQLEAVWQQAVEIWSAGGWAMIAIAVIRPMIASHGDRGLGERGKKRRSKDIMAARKRFDG